MAKRLVHWYEGMFLKPHHFQAADRYMRDRIRESEDWLHPHDWGVRLADLDADAIGNFLVVLRGCQARFKDGTTVSIPEEVTIDPLELRSALATQPEVTLYLAVPTMQAGRENVTASRAGDGPRYYLSTIESADENTGGDEEPLEFRNVHVRLLHSDLDTTGYEVLPIARIARSTSAEAPPRIDESYVPPILCLEAWPPLQNDVRALFQQIASWVDQESRQIVGRKISFESQVVGDAERVLRLSQLNSAYAVLRAILPTRGLHPFDVYRELCRFLGQLSIFGETRRPIEVPAYDHENIGPIYAEVITEIRRLLGSAATVAFEKRYFQLEGRRFLVHLDPEWTLETTRLYVGVETSEVTDAECDQMIRTTDWKLGSAEQVEQIFLSAAAGLRMQPLNRIPSALPAGVVYFEIEKNPTFWKDVVRTRTLGLRFKGELGSFRTNQLFAMPSPSGRTVELRFAVFVVKNK